MAQGLTASYSCTAVLYTYYLFLPIYTMRRTIVFHCRDSFCLVDILLLLIPGYYTTDGAIFTIRKIVKLKSISVFEKLGPGTKSKVQVQRRSLWPGPKHFTKFGLPTTTHHHHPHKLLGHF